MSRKSFAFLLKDKDKEKDKEKTAAASENGSEVSKSGSLQNGNSFHGVQQPPLPEPLPPLPEPLPPLPSNFSKPPLKERFSFSLSKKKSNGFLH